MIILVQALRVVLILVLAMVTLSALVGLTGSGTGLLEKSALVALIVGCIYLATRVSALSAWMVHRLTHR